MIRLKNVLILISIEQNVTNCLTRFKTKPAWAGFKTAGLNCHDVPMGIWHEDIQNKTYTAPSTVSIVSKSQKQKKHI